MDNREIEKDLLTTNNYLAKAVKELPFKNPELMGLMNKYGPIEFMVMVIIGMLNGIRNFAENTQLSKVELVRMFVMYCEIDVLTYTQVGMEMISQEQSDDEGEHEHDCDNCDFAGKCPLEGDVRARKAAQQAVSGSDEGKDEEAPGNVVQLRRSRLN